MSGEEVSVSPNQAEELLTKEQIQEIFVERKQKADYLKVQADKKLLFGVREVKISDGDIQHGHPLPWIERAFYISPNILPDGWISFPDDTRVTFYRDNRDKEAYKVMEIAVGGSNMLHLGLKKPASPGYLYPLYEGNEVHDYYKITFDVPPAKIEDKVFDLGDVICNLEMAGKGKLSMVFNKDGQINYLGVIPLEPLENGKFRNAFDIFQLSSVPFTYSIGLQERARTQGGQIFDNFDTVHFYGRNLKGYRVELKPNDETTVKLIISKKGQVKHEITIPTSINPQKFQEALLPMSVLDDPINTPATPTERMRLGGKFLSALGVDWKADGDKQDAKQANVLELA